MEDLACQSMTVIMFLGSFWPYHIQANPVQYTPLGDSLGSGTPLSHEEF